MAGAGGAGAQAASPVTLSQEVAHIRGLAVPLGLRLGQMHGLLTRVYNPGPVR